jgi:DNA-binding response OmpR family regulator
MSGAHDPNPKVILVVEDDEAVRTMLQRALGTTYRVHTATNGLEAAEMLGVLGRFDLLVCDVMMPQVDGLSLVRLMRSKEELKNIPVLFLSAKSSPQAVVEGLSLGVKHYMTKPFKVKELMDRVAKLLGGAP